MTFFYEGKMFYIMDKTLHKNIYHCTPPAGVVGYGKVQVSCLSFHWNV